MLAKNIHLFTHPKHTNTASGYKVQPKKIYTQTHKEKIDPCLRPQPQSFIRTLYQIMIKASGDSWAYKMMRQHTFQAPQSGWAYKMMQQQYTFQAPQSGSATSSKGEIKPLSTNVFVIMVGLVIGAAIANLAIFCLEKLLCHTAKSQPVL